MGSKSAKNPNRLTYSRMMTGVNAQLKALNDSILRNYRYMTQSFSKKKLKGGTRRRRS